MIDDYPSFSDSSLLGANVYYRGTVALGAHEGGLRKVGMPGIVTGMSGD